MEQGVMAQLHFVLPLKDKPRSVSLFQSTRGTLGFRGKAVTLNDLGVTVSFKNLTESRNSLPRKIHTCTHTDALISYMI